MKIQYIDRFAGRKRLHKYLPCRNPLDLVVGLWYYNNSRHKRNITEIAVIENDELNNFSVLPGYGKIEDIVKEFSAHNNTFVKPKIRYINGSRK